MPLSKCIRRCWDSQATKRYYPGDIAEFPENHVFLAGKIKCFEPISLDEISKSHQDTDAKIQQMGTMISDLSKKINSVSEEDTKLNIDVEARKGPGRPPKPKE